MNADTTKTILWVLSILYGILIVGSFFPIMMSPFLFDAGATKGRWVTFFSIVAFPILALISIIAAWWFFKHGHYSAAKWVFTLPALSIIGFFVGFSMP